MIRENCQGLIGNWNSANGFVFFGKGGEIATNRVRDKEIAALAPHCPYRSFSPERVLPATRVPGFKPLSYARR